MLAELYNRFVNDRRGNSTAVPVPYASLEELFTKGTTLPFTSNNHYDHFFMPLGLKLPRRSETYVHLKNPGYVIAVNGHHVEEDKIGRYLDTMHNYDQTLLRDAKRYATPRAKEGHLRATLEHADRFKPNVPDIPKETCLMLASSGIFVKKYSLMSGKKGLAIIIKADPHPLAPQNTCNQMAFGLHGTLDKEDNIHIDRLMVPLYDMGRYKGLQDIEVTSDNVQTYLKYAELCVQQIATKETLNAGANLQANGLKP